jgi:uncharacterized OsmC-like protein
VQQRAIIRLNEELVKLAQQEDYAIYCDDENFKKQAGKRPSPLQYFIASIGFCMFSQLRRFAATAEVTIDDLEMDLRMTYDLTQSRIFPTRRRGSVIFLRSKAPLPSKTSSRLRSRRIEVAIP